MTRSERPDLVEDRFNIPPARLKLARSVKNFEKPYTPFLFCFMVLDEVQRTKAGCGTQPSFKIELRPQLEFCVLPAEHGRMFAHLKQHHLCWSSTGKPIYSYQKFTSKRS